MSAFLAVLTQVTWALVVFGLAWATDALPLAFRLGLPFALVIGFMVTMFVFAHLCATFMDVLDSP